MQKALSFSNVALVSVKGNAYRTYSWYRNKDEAINRINNTNLSEKSGSL